MSNYYTKQDAKVRMAHELMKMGWNVEGITFYQLMILSNFLYY